MQVDGTTLTLLGGLVVISIMGLPPMIDDWRRERERKRAQAKAAR